ncbi:MAG: Double-strand break repair protein mre11a, partial [Paramarteilia canceri]
IAQKFEADVILHGGDLYHHNRPSKYTEKKCMELIKQYTFGSKKKLFSIIKSDRSFNFDDPNLDVAYPIFAIHGNHDDRAGAKRISAIDVLDSAGLVNLIGCNDNVSSELVIKPIVLQKGATKLAIYGLGSIRDERLYRQFERGQVR